MIPLLTFLAAGAAAAVARLIYFYRLRKRVLRTREIQQRLIQWNYEARN